MWRFDTRRAAQPISGRLRLMEYVDQRLLHGAADASILTVWCGEPRELRKSIVDGRLNRRTVLVRGSQAAVAEKHNLKILDRVGSPRLKVYCDVGNSNDKGRDVL